MAIYKREDMPPIKQRSKFPLFLQIPSTLVIWSLVGFVLPWLIYSLFHSYIPGKGAVFIGLNNIISILFDFRLMQSVLKTIYYVGVGAFLEVFLGMIVALALVNIIRNSIIRFIVLLIFLIPMMLSEAIAAHVWLMLVTPQGYINSILRFLGLPPVGWLSEQMGLTTLILADVWQWASLPLLLIYSARIAIPIEMYEMAELDKLSSWKIFRIITWPNIRYAVIVSLLLRIIGMYTSIDKIILITYGGPGIATETIGFYVFLQAFSYRNVGYAATLSFMTLIVAGIFSYLLWRKIMKEG
ncbi:MAG: sugar ABC transporter permease [Candidatus Methanomethylicaceae archaeon]